MHAFHKDPTLFVETFETALFRSKYLVPNYVEKKLEGFCIRFLPALLYAPKGLGGLGEQDYMQLETKGVASQFKALCGLTNKLLLLHMKETDALADPDCFVIGKVTIRVQNSFLLGTLLQACAISIACELDR